jgi:hypothetical protein
MSNRFHNKWHRKNHHTYGNASNPDASHDPIASSHQPFLGDFVLQGSLCAVAPMSAFGAYVFSNYTAICAFAGYTAIRAKSFGFPGLDSIGIQVDAQNIAISAHGVAVGLNVHSPVRAISAYSRSIAIEAYGHTFGHRVYSNSRAISAYGSYTAAELYGVGRALSAMSPNLGIEVYSNQRAISAYATNVGIEVRAENTALSASSTNLAGSFYANNRALSAYASIVAGEFRSPNTGTLIYGGTRALSAYSGYTAAELYGVGRALSAMSPNLGIEVYSNQRAISAYATNVGIEVRGENTALSASSTNLAGSFYANNRALSAYGTIVAGEFRSPNTGSLIYGGNRALSAYGSAIGVEVASPNVAISAYSPKIAIRAYAPIYNQNNDGVRALDVRGYSYFDGDVEISGSLSANGYISRFDTYVVVTSATYIENKGTETALTVIQRGSVPVAHFYDDGNSAFFIDGKTLTPGYVGINTETPNERLTVVGNISGYSDHISFGNSRASGTWSFSEGTSQATGNISHAEGSGSTASGFASHSEGFTTTSSASASHAEGSLTRASGQGSHAEGNQTTASGIHSHAEGDKTLASGIASHAAGIRSTASENYSYIWSGDNTLGTNAQTSLDRQYLIYAPSGVYIPRGIVGIGTGTDYPNINYPLTVNGRISSKGLELWNNSVLKFGYFPEVNDGAEMFFQSDSGDYGRLIIQTIDNADSTIVLRQRDQNGPNNYNRLVVGSDGNLGIATGTLTSIETFDTNLAIYGTLSSYSSYVGDKLYFGSGLSPDTNLYRSAANTLKTDDSFIVDGASTTINSTTITLGDANTDTVTINAGPVNIPNATTAADALILGGDVNLYRDAANTLKTDGSLIVTQQLSAKALQQGIILAANANAYIIPLSAEAYQVYPITTSTVIGFSGMQPGRTTNVLLSSYVGTAQSIGPDPRFIYLDGRPTSLPAGKVLLFEIVSFGTTLSSVVIKSKIQP